MKVKLNGPIKVTVGYLDQHAVLEKGMTIRVMYCNELLMICFVMEQKINDAYNRMGDVSEDEMNKLLEQVGEWQEILEQRGFYEIDAVIERTAAGFGLMDIGLDRDVTELSGGQRTKVLLTKLLLENQLFCYWTNRQTILMWSIFNGCKTIYKTTKMLLS